MKTKSRRRDQHREALVARRQQATGKRRALTMQKTTDLRARLQVISWVYYINTKKKLTLPDLVTW